MKLETLRNGIANLLGGALPILVVIFTTPYVVNTLGANDYGLLTLITAITGYFAILDINVKAGSIKFVSEYHAAREKNKLNQTLTAGLMLYVLIGIAGSILIFFLADVLVREVFRVPAHSLETADSSLKLAALAFLFGQIQIYLASVPQALRRYDQSALLETIFGMLAPLSNVVVLWLGGGIFEIVLVRVILSVINILVLTKTIFRLIPDLRLTKPSLEVTTQLTKFSGYAYLSSLAWLAFVYGDKLILGAVASMAALTYYSIPQTLSTRVYQLSFRLSAVLFPASSTLQSRQEMEQLKDLYLYSARYILFVQCVLSFYLLTLSREILHYWISPEMSVNASLILILLVLANLMDSLTNAPSLVNDGLGKPKVTGLFSVARSVAGLLLTFLLVKEAGVLGAAISQFLVFSVYAIALLYYVHGRTIPVEIRDYLRVVLLPNLPLILAMLAITWLLQSGNVMGITATTILFATETIVLLAYGYRVIARQTDIDALGRYLSSEKFNFLNRKRSV